MDLPPGWAVAIKVAPAMTSTLLHPFIEAIGVLLADGVNDGLVEAVMARCLVDHKDPLPVAWHLVNARCQARHEGLRFAEPGWAMPERGDGHGQLAIGRSGGRRATDRRPPSSAMGS